MEYEVLQGWEQLPEGWSFVEVAGVAVDSRDRVYVFNRGEHPVIVFDKEGQFLNAWGEDIFTNAHGIYIDENDHLFCADHFDHTVRKLTTIPPTPASRSITARSAVPPAPSIW